MTEDELGDGFVVVDVPLHQCILHRLQILLQTFLFVDGDIHFGSHQVSCFLFVITNYFFDAFGFFGE